MKIYTKDRYGNKDINGGILVIENSDGEKATVRPLDRYGNYDPNNEPQEIEISNEDILEAEGISKETALGIYFEKAATRKVKERLGDLVSKLK